MTEDTNLVTYPKYFVTSQKQVDPTMENAGYSKAAYVYESGEHGRFLVSIHHDHSYCRRSPKM